MWFYYGVRPVNQLKNFRVIVTKLTFWCFFLITYCTTLIIGAATTNVNSFMGLGGGIANYCWYIPGY